eukprot:TRINITY_DN16882_c0_g1_i1.p1 TRINITY_DN16882_c0_g1~~TRINITY_DN16882_c0_g1_i1.p1  ORF type:complete len:130 (+),score=7.03 TRINITY_DN16882_c0_g1_i1:25-390(+)
MRIRGCSSDVCSSEFFFFFFLLACMLTKYHARTECDSGETTTATAFKLLAPRRRHNAQVYQQSLCMNNMSSHSSLRCSLKYKRETENKNAVPGRRARHSVPSCRQNGNVSESRQSGGNETS